MLYTQLPVFEQVILSLAAVSVLLSLAMLAQPRIKSVVKLFAAQGLFLTATTAAVAYDLHQHHLYFSALLTLLLKVGFIPYLLLRMVNKFGLRHETDEIRHLPLLMLGCGALIVFCYEITLPIARSTLVITHNLIGLCMAIVLMGMLMLITRHKAITQVVGFMCMENGLFFAAVSITSGMPLVVELGIAFDVLIAAIIFGVFFLHLDESIESMDIGQLSLLSERELPEHELSERELPQREPTERE